MRNHVLGFQLFCRLPFFFIVTIARIRTAVPGPRSIALKKNLNEMQVRPISSTKCCNHHHTTIIILVMIRRCPASPSSRTTTPPMATTSPTWTGTPSLTVSCRWTSFQSTAPRQHHLRVWDITIPAQIASIPLGYNHPRILEALRDERNVKAMANRFGPNYRCIWTITTFPSLLVDNLSWWALIRPALGWFPCED